MRANFKTGEQEFHSGEDYPAEYGDFVAAASTGTVVYSGFTGSGSGENGVGFGYTVIVESVGGDGGKYYTLYAHLTGAGMPAKGTEVGPGSFIGEVGLSGRSTGAHLHFEVLVPGINQTELTFPASGTGPLGFATGQFSVNPATFDNWGGDGPYQGGLGPPNPFYSGGGGPSDIQDENGNIIGAYDEDHGDGVLVSFRYWGDGLHSEYYDHGDGTTDYEIFTANGSRSHFFQTWGDAHEEITYYSIGDDYLDGQYYYREWHGSDGTSFEIEDRKLDGSEIVSFQFADGTYGSSWFDGGDTYHSEWYDEGGIYFSIQDQFESGAWNASYALEDGSHGSATIDADGLGTNEWYYADGSGEIHTRTLEGDGRTYQVDRILQADGSYGETWEYSDGAYGNKTFDATTKETNSISHGADGSWRTDTNVDLPDGSYQHAWELSDGRHGIETFDATSEELTSESYEADGDFAISNHQLLGDGSEGDATALWNDGAGQLTEEISFQGGSSVTFIAGGDFDVDPTGWFNWTATNSSNDETQSVAILWEEVPQFSWSHTIYDQTGGYVRTWTELVGEHLSYGTDYFENGEEEGGEIGSSDENTVILSQDGYTFSLSFANGASATWTFDPIEQSAQGTFQTAIGGPSFSGEYFF
jgi:hypothetical protein